MTSEVDTPDEYIAQLPEERKAPVIALRDTVRRNLPSGFAETLSYGMIGFCVPHSRYPAGYHADPNQPVPFIAIASQKQHIALYHMGIYAFPDLLAWFTAEYQRRTGTKPDMGKSCLRFRKTGQIPYELIGELCQKITVDDWIERYEQGRQGRGQR